MVNTLILLSIVVFISVQQITKKAYNQKRSGGAMSFSAASCVAALALYPVFMAIGRIGGQQWKE